MAFWADGFYASGFWANGFWAEGALTEVPDVTGETQAAATSTLQGDGFVVSVVEAYSDSVALGLVISQEPTAGAFANGGSTVVITVSLGVQPVVDDQPMGGWAFLNTYEAELQRRRERERRRKELEDEADEIEDDLDRNIAQLLHEQEGIDERKADLERLAKLAQAQTDLEAARAYSDRVAKAYERAVEKGTYSALEALERELKRAAEEEEFLVLSMMVLLDG